MTTAQKAAATVTVAECEAAVAALGTESAASAFGMMLLRASPLAILLCPGDTPRKSKQDYWNECAKSGGLKGYSPMCGAKDGPPLQPKVGTAIPAGTSLEDQQKYMREKDSNPAAAIAELNNAPKAGSSPSATPKQTQASNDEIVYHGTTSDQTITSKGLQTAERDRAGGDFAETRGFSTTTHRATAQIWAEARAAERGGQPVVLEANRSDLPPPRDRPNERVDKNEVRIDVEDYPKVGPGVFRVSKPK
jgi:hypothetical protein